MPIEKIEQPQIIEIDDTLRLRRYDGKFDFAFEWYQDTETVYLVDGVKEPYTLESFGGCTNISMSTASSILLKPGKTEIISPSAT